ncbi:MAG: anti-sigma factor antagonist [Clostridia bacterium]
MEFRWSQNDNKLTVYLKGELDHHSAEQTRMAIDATLRDKRITKLVIDMQGVTFMDSSGLGVILGRYNILNARNGTISITNVNRSIDRIFKMSGIYSIIKD